MIPPAATRRYHVRVCRGPECGDRRGSKAIYEAFRAALEARGFSPRVDLGWQSCFGRCSQGPNLLVREVTPGGTPGGSGVAGATTPATALYNGVDVVHVEELVTEHVGHGLVVRSLVRRPALIAGSSLVE